MRHTHHASLRMQQRSIPPLIAEWLDEFGDEVPAPHGGVIRFFGKRAKRLLRDFLGKPMYSKVKSLLNTYQVVDDNVVITAGKRYKKIRKNF